MQVCQAVAHHWEGREIAVRDNCVAFAAEIIGIFFEIPCSYLIFNEGSTGFGTRFEAFTEKGPAYSKYTAAGRAIFEAASVKHLFPSIIFDLFFERYECMSKGRSLTHCCRKVKLKEAMKVISELVDKIVQENANNQEAMSIHFFLLFSCLLTCNMYRLCSC